MKYLKIVLPIILLILSVNVKATTVTGGSDLLTGAYANQLESWLGQGSISLNNIFDKVSGNSSYDFHAAVDGMGATFSIMQIFNGTEELIIGGYNPQSWSSNSGWSSTGINEAFLFNLTTSSYYAEGAGYYGDRGMADGLYQTYNHASYGPTFGGGHDLYINSSLSGGYANLGYSYGCNVGTNGSQECRNDFTGSYASWTLGDIEVFSVAPSTVPVPAAAWLFGSALLGFFGFSRRKAKA